MSAVETLAAEIAEPARDIRLNLQSVLAPGSLTPAQRWGVAIASAVASRNVRLQVAVIADARAEVAAAVVEDAVAAAAIMGMNNVYYSFKHLIGKESYGERRAGLIVDELVGQQEIVVKQFDGVRGGLALFSGATILGDGAPALIVDVSSLL